MNTTEEKTPMQQLADYLERILVHHNINIDRFLEMEKKQIDDLESQISGIYEGAALWEQEYYDCRVILSTMVQRYESAERMAIWHIAHKFLKKYQHLGE